VSAGGPGKSSTNIRSKACARRRHPALGNGEAALALGSGGSRRRATGKQDRRALARPGRRCIGTRTAAGGTLKGDGLRTMIGSAGASWSHRRSRPARATARSRCTQGPRTRTRREYDQRQQKAARDCRAGTGGRRIRPAAIFGDVGAVVIGARHGCLASGSARSTPERIKPSVKDIVARAPSGLCEGSAANDQMGQSGIMSAGQFDYFFALAIGFRHRRPYRQRLPARHPRAPQSLPPAGAGPRVPRPSRRCRSWSFAAPFIIMRQYHPRMPHRGPGLQHGDGGDHHCRLFGSLNVGHGGGDGRSPRSVSPAG